MAIIIVTVLFEGSGLTVGLPPPVACEEIVSVPGEKNNIIIKESSYNT